MTHLFLSLKAFSILVLGVLLFAVGSLLFTAFFIWGLSRLTFDIVPFSWPSVLLVWLLVTMANYFLRGRASDCLTDQ